MNNPDEEWQPPSEEELHALRVRQERSNRISKIIGDYLLKGYKMLGSTCPECDTILLRDRQQKDICVGCAEVDVAPSNKEVSSEVNMEAESSNQGRPDNSTVLDFSIPSSSSRQRFDDNDGLLLSDTQSNPRLSVTRQHSTPSPARSPADRPVPVTGKNISSASTRCHFGRTQTVLQQKLEWATEELQRTCSVESSIQLCNLIKATLETLEVLSRSNSGNHGD